MVPTGNTTRIERALNYRLYQLTLTPARRIADPGEVFTPVVGEIYLATGVLWNTSGRGETGSQAARRHRGIYQINVRGPETGNPEPQTEVADALIEHFDRQVVSHSSVVVRIGNFDGGNAVPWRGPRLTNAGWALIAVSVPFWCDVFPT